MADAHGGGWTNYLARLRAVAEGRDPGPDPLAGERVPAVADLEAPGVVRQVTVSDAPTNSTENASHHTSTVHGPDDTEKSRGIS